MKEKNTVPQNKQPEYKHLKEQTLIQMYLFAFCPNYQNIIIVLIYCV